MRLMSGHSLDEKNSAIFGDRVGPRFRQVGDLDQQVVDVVLYEGDLLVQVLLISGRALDTTATTAITSWSRSSRGSSSW